MEVSTRHVGSCKSAELQECAGEISVREIEPIQAHASELAVGVRDVRSFVRDPCVRQVLGTDPLSRPSPPPRSRVLDLPFGPRLCVERGLNIDRAIRTEVGLAEGFSVEGEVRLAPDRLGTTVVLAEGPDRDETVLCVLPPSDVSRAVGFAVGEVPPEQLDLFRRRRSTEHNPPMVIHGPRGDDREAEERDQGRPDSRLAAHRRAILAMYHDQGLVGFKALSFGSGVNYTAGLPAVRTSPDHGTAYDIAGKGIADPSSFRQALYLAIDIARNRKDYAEMHADPLKKKAKHTEDKNA